MLVTTIYNCMCMSANSLFQRELNNFFSACSTVYLPAPCSSSWRTGNFHIIRQAQRQRFWWLEKGQAVLQPNLPLCVAPQPCALAGSKLLSCSTASRSLKQDLPLEQRWWLRVSKDVKWGVSGTSNVSRCHKDISYWTLKLLFNHFTHSQIPVFAYRISAVCYVFSVKIELFSSKKVFSNL